MDFDFVTVFTSQESTSETQRLIEGQFSPSSAARVADEAIASHKLPAVTEPEKLEFRALVDEAFKFVREQSAELANDVVKDLAVHAVEAFILGPIVALILQVLRSKPGNRIASGCADILKALIETKQENPTMSVNELAKRVNELGVSVNELGVSVKAALQLAGYQEIEGRLVPPTLSVDALRAKSPFWKLLSSGPSRGQKSAFARDFGRAKPPDKGANEEKTRNGI